MKKFILLFLQLSICLGATVGPVEARITGGSGRVRQAARRNTDKRPVRQQSQRPAARRQRPQAARSRRVQARRKQRPQAARRVHKQQPRARRSRQVQGRRRQQPQAARRVRRQWPQARRARQVKGRRRQRSQATRRTGPRRTQRPTVYIHPMSGELQRDYYLERQKAYYKNYLSARAYHFFQHQVFMSGELRDSFGNGLESYVRSDFVDQVFNYVRACDRHGRRPDENTFRTYRYFGDRAFTPEQITIKTGCASPSRSQSRMRTTLSGRGTSATIGVAGPSRDNWTQVHLDYSGEPTFRRTLNNFLKLANAADARMHGIHVVRGVPVVHFRNENLNLSAAGTMCVWHKLYNIIYINAVMNRQEPPTEREFLALCRRRGINPIEPANSDTAFRAYKELVGVHSELNFANLFWAPDGEEHVFQGKPWVDRYDGTNIIEMRDDAQRDAFMVRVRDYLAVEGELRIAHFGCGHRDTDVPHTTLMTVVSLPDNTIGISVLDNLENDRNVKTDRTWNVYLNYLALKLKIVNVS